MHIRHAGNRRAGKVHRHGHAVLLDRVADFLGFENAAGSRQIRMQNIDGVISRQLDEVLP